MSTNLFKTLPCVRIWLALQAWSEPHWFCMLAASVFQQSRSANKGRIWALVLFTWWPLEYIHRGLVTKTIPRQFCLPKPAVLQKYGVFIHFFSPSVNSLWTFLKIAAVQLLGTTDNLTEALQDARTYSHPYLARELIRLSLSVWTDLD